MRQNHKTYLAISWIRSPRCPTVERRQNGFTANICTQIDIIDSTRHVCQRIVSRIFHPFHYKKFCRSHAIEHFESV